MSPLIVVKGDYCTALTPAGIIRCLRVHHPSVVRCYRPRKIARPWFPMISSGYTHMFRSGWGRDHTRRGLEVVRLRESRPRPTQAYAGRLGQG